jgi:hypothetical protein
LGDGGHNIDKGFVTLLFQIFDQLLGFFVEDVDEVLEDVEVESWGQNFSPRLPLGTFTRQQPGAQPGVQEVVQETLGVLFGVCQNHLQSNLHFASPVEESYLDVFRV